MDFYAELEESSLDNGGLKLDFLSCERFSLRMIHEEITSGILPRSLEWFDIGMLIRRNIFCDNGNRASADRHALGKKGLIRDRFLLQERTTVSYFFEETRLLFFRGKRFLARKFLDLAFELFIAGLEAFLFFR